MQLFVDQHLEAVTAEQSAQPDQERLTKYSHVTPFPGQRRSGRVLVQCRSSGIPGGLHMLNVRHLCKKPSASAYNASTQVRGDGWRRLERNVVDMPRSERVFQTVPPPEQFLTVTADATRGGSPASTTATSRTPDSCHTGTWGSRTPSSDNPSSGSDRRSRSADMLCGTVVCRQPCGVAPSHRGG